MKKIDLAVLAQEVAQSGLSGLSPDIIVQWCSFSLDLDKKRQDIVTCLEKIRATKGEEAKEAENKYLLEEQEYAYNKFLSQAQLAQIASNSKWNTALYMLLHNLIVIESNNEPIGDIQGK